MTSNNWKNCNLGDVLTFQRGYDLPKQHRSEGTVPIVSSSGISGYHDSPKVKGPGVVTGRYGTLGEVFYIKEPFWPLNTTLYVKDFKDNDPLFISYFLKTLNLSQQNAAGAVPGLNRNALHLLAVRIPQHTTQHKIASILSAYDDLIENNTRRIKILEDMAQMIYREWFVKFRFPGHEKMKIVDSAIGEIPEGWKVGPINDVVSIKSGFAFKTTDFDENGTYGLVTIKNVQDSQFNPECTNCIENLSTRMPDYCFLHEGDILLSLTGNIGRVCLVYGRNLLLNQRVAKLVPLTPQNRAFVYLTFRQTEIREKLEKLSTGVAQQNLSPIETGKLEFCMPDKTVLSEFADICEPIINEILVLYKRNQNLRQTRDLLLPKLISGEVGVERLEILTES